MTLTALFAYSLALAIAVAIPGPGVAAIIGKALGSGLRRTLPFIAGLACGDVVFLAMAVLGLAVLAQTFAGVFTVVRYAGVVYLLYLAWRFWHASIEPADVQQSRTGGGFGDLLAGFAVTMSNPKTIVFNLALIPTVIDIRAVTLMDFAVLAVLTVVILFMILTPYAYMASRARMMIRRPRALKTLNRVAAGAMASAAGVIAVRS